MRHETLHAGTDWFSPYTRPPPSGKISRLMLQFTSLPELVVQPTKRNLPLDCPELEIGLEERSQSWRK